MTQCMNRSFQPFSRRRCWPIVGLHSVHAEFARLLRSRWLR